MAHTLIYECLYRYTSTVAYESKGKKSLFIRLGKKQLNNNNSNKILKRKEKIASEVHRTRFSIDITYKAALKI